ncbi:PilN domain-containing protein [Massilia sp. IC2-477]|uniref:PilN domain-containing protein n=1 Tax=Massilia sp. IC2-477 TaxID=2887198 RepID=UPI001D0FE0EA|nr:PilN domain-containing protein [Massilia sp. IC2-477]
MKRTHIDFAPRTLRRALFRVPSRFGVFLVATAMLCLVLASQLASYREEREQLDALQAAIAARSQAARPLPVAAMPRFTIPEAQAQAVNEAVMQLNLPWRDLVEAVRAATPASVALLALEPDAKRRSLRITAETKNSDDMLAYVAQMQEQGWFASVNLVRHEIAEQEPNRPLRFQLNAQWSGGQ